MSNSECAADIVLITNTIARISQLADGGDLDEYLRQFTDDAVWTMPANPATGVAEQRRVGTADIGAGSAERRSSGIQGPGSNTRHVVSTSSVDVLPTTVESVATAATGSTESTAATEAKALSYFRFYVDTVDAPRLATMGTYRDEFRRVDGRWLLAARTIGLG